jgi:hypothetical protein
MFAGEDIDKIKNMSFVELRDELCNCNNNPIKEMLIRKLMKQKYIYIRQRKKQNEKIIKRMYKKNSKTMKEKKDDESDENYDFLEDGRAYEIDNKEIIFTEDDFNIMPDHGSLNELENGSHNERYVDEIKRDTMNNQLMDRMNNELEICYFNKFQKYNKNSFLHQFNSPQVTVNKNTQIDSNKNIINGNSNRFNNNKLFVRTFDY